MNHQFLTIIKLDIRIYLYGVLLDHKKKELALMLS